MGAGIPLGPYVLVRRLATGGMAEIFLARREGPEGFARELVVKRILPHLAADRQFTSMFLEEARIAARLSHPNIVQVFDFGRVDDTYYLVMEFVRGVDLRALINRARDINLKHGRSAGIPAHHAAKIASLVCEGLAAAHDLKKDGQSVGLVHRDITPSNVLISFEGAVKITDFGIVKSDLELEATSHGVVEGKYTYMSPEQARGHPLDARSDLFNVGILLFESLAGQMLFPPHDSKGAKRMSASGIIPKPERIDRLPPDLARIIRRALEPNPENRYTDALALRADLEQYLRSSSETSDQVEIGRYVRTTFPDVLEEDAKAPRAAGTVPMTVAEGSPIEIPIELTKERGIPTEMAEPPTTMSGRRDRRSGVAWWALFLAIGIVASIITGTLAFVIFAEEPPEPTEPAAEPPEPRPPPETPAPGELRVTSDPLGLAVFIDGEDRGVSPLAVSLPSGRTYRVELRRGDTIVGRREVELAPNQVAELEIEAAAPEDARLRVVSVPAGATVLVAGSPSGTTPLELAIAPGEYPIEVRADGYRSQEGTAVLSEPGETATLSFVLARAPSGQQQVPDRQPERGSGTLAVATTPYSEVYLGGRHLGTTPFRGVSLPAGSHTLRFESPGRPSRRQRVVITANEETRVRLTL
jgi:serine/threonine-protein kinase